MLFLPRFPEKVAATPPPVCQSAIKRLKRPHYTRSVIIASRGRGSVMSVSIGDNRAIARFERLAKVPLFISTTWNATGFSLMCTDARKCWLADGALPSALLAFHGRRIVVISTTLRPSCTRPWLATPSYEIIAVVNT